MEIDTLRLLVDVSRLGSLAAVARTHDLDPSSISRAVAQAEHELGVRIFQRTTRRLSLTEAGQLFLQRIEPVIDEFDRAREHAQDQQAQVTGTIRITTSVAFGQSCFVPLLGAFRDAFPALKVELVLSDSALDLVRERIDLAIRLGPAVDGDMICTKLRTTRYRVCASGTYLAEAGPLRKPTDLSEHQSLLFPFPGFRSRWLFRTRKGHVTEVPVQGAITISNALGLRDAAVAGLGPALLADWLVDDDIGSGRLVDVFPSYDVAATTFDTAAWMVYPNRAFVPAKVRRTIDFLRRHLGR